LSHHRAKAATDIENIYEEPDYDDPYCRDWDHEEKANSNEK